MRPFWSAHSEDLENRENIFWKKSVLNREDSIIGRNDREKVRVDEKSDV